MGRLRAIALRAGSAGVHGPGTSLTRSRLAIAACPLWSCPDTATKRTKRPAWERVWLQVSSSEAIGGPQCDGPRNLILEGRPNWLDSVGEEKS